MIRDEHVARLARADAEWRAARAGRELSDCRDDHEVKRAAAVVSAVLRNATLAERQAYAEMELDHILGTEWRQGPQAEPPEAEI